MGKQHVIMTAFPSRKYRVVAVSAAVALAVGCSVFASPVAAQSLSDRFKGLFGGGSSDQPAQPAPGAPNPGPSDSRIEETCPPVSIRAGASTYSVAAPGKEAVGDNVRYQASITKIARDCRRTGDDITARIGIQGRVIAGPAGAPETVEIPMRVAVVQGGVNEKTIATKAYRTTVAMDSGRIGAVYAGRRRCGVPNRSRRDRGFLHFLYRIRSAGADAGEGAGQASQKEIAL